MKKTFVSVILTALCVLLSPSLRGQTPVWTSLDRGDIRAMVVQKDGSLIVGAQGGLYLSTDGGDTWPWCTNTKQVYALATDSLGTVFAGSEGGTIYFSTDAGRTWRASGIPMRATIGALCADSSGIVYAGTPGYGLLATTDHGQSWHASGLTYATILGLTAAPGNVLLAVKYNDGIYRSTDHGNVWVKVASPGSTFRVIAAVGDRIFGGGVGAFQSTDFGVTWTSFGLAGISISQFIAGPHGMVYAFGPSGVYQTAQGDTNWTAMVLPWQAETSAWAFAGDTIMFAAAARDLYASSSSNVWKKLGSETKNLSVNALACIGGRLIAAAGGPGVLSSDNGGAVWDVEDTIVSHREVRSLLVANGGRVFAGTANGQVLVSEDSGSHWTSTGVQWDDPFVQTLAADERGRLLAATFGGGIYASTDAGVHWDPMSTETANRYVRKLLVARNGRIMAGGDDGLHVSTDQGTTWLPASTFAGTTVWCLAEDAGGRLYAGTADKGLYRSTDGGDDWIPITANLAGLTISALASDTNGVLFVGTLGGGVFRSDGGQSWTMMNTGLTDLEITSLLLTGNRELYAGTVRYWAFKISLQTITGVRELSVSYPDGFALEQNYPNPFNPTTAIRYTLSRPSHVTLSVFNTLGQQVANLVNMEKGAGYHQLMFDGSRLASGVYFYRILAHPLEQGRTGAADYRETKKMLKVK